MKDPYLILGVKRSASDAEIKKTYRKLAKKLHPDRNPGDDKVAKRFKEVSAAYSIVGDKKQRAKFDRGEIDASGAAAQPFAGGGGGFEEAFRGFRQGQRRGEFRMEGGGEDFFSELFGLGRGRSGRGGPRRGQDVLYSVSIPFIDAARGGEQRVRLDTGKALNVKIPAGVSDGQRIRLSGQGHKGASGGRAGDAFIEIKIKPHPLFERQGDNIHVVVPITIDEAVLGAKISVPTIDKPVSVTVPKGTSSGRKLRLKGKGIKSGRTAGDQIVSLNIVLPKKGNRELEDLLGKWRSNHAYEVRKDLKGG
jgi:DnaJ-class molecular chaperone